MKTRLKNIAAATLWWSGIGPLIRSVREPRLVAIAYHRVSDVAHPLAIHPHAFVAQIAYLKKRGYQFARFHELTQDYAFSCVREEKRNCQTIKYDKFDKSEETKKSKKTEKKAAIYFDDGFRDLTTIDIPATFFLTTDYLDQKNGSEYLTWQEAMQLKTRGEIGSHSVSHRKLTKMPLAEAREEMARSKKILEERLDVDVTSFSYPKGRNSQALETLAREAGYTITTADKRFRKVRPDPDESLTIFKLKLLGIL